MGKLRGEEIRLGLKFDFVGFVDRLEGGLRRADIRNAKRLAARQTRDSNVTTKTGTLRRARNDASNGNTARAQQPLWIFESESTAAKQLGGEENARQGYHLTGLAMR